MVVRQHVCKFGNAVREAPRGVWFVVSGVFLTCISAPAFADGAPWPASATAPANLGGSVDGIYRDAAGRSYDGTGYTVVDIDGAFHLNNPAFTAANGSSKIVHEACFGQKTDTPFLSLCNTSNFVKRPLPQNPGSGYYFYNLPGSSRPSNAPWNVCRNDDIYCHNSHGTATAGLIAGQPRIRNESGVSMKYTGVAPGARLITLKVGGGSPTREGWPINSVVDALNHVDKVLLPRADFGTSIVAVNLSVSGGAQAGRQVCGPGSDGARINEIAGILRSKGVAVVMAAGNDGVNAAGSWSCGSNVIAVGATGILKPTVPTHYTNVAPNVQLFAPVGTGDRASRDFILAPWTDQGSSYVEGTSFASPQVAGAFAVLRQKFGRGPSVDQLLELMQSSGKELSGRRICSASPEASVLDIGAALYGSPLNQ